MTILEKIIKNLNFNFHDYYRFRYLLDSEIVSSKPPKLKYRLFVIKSVDELNELLKDGYDFCESPIIKTIDENESGNITLFLYFVDRNLAHFNCLEEKLRKYFGGVGKKIRFFSVPRTYTSFNLVKHAVRKNSDFKKNI